MAPCYECCSRTVGCHGSCARYLEFRRTQDEQKRQRANDPIAGYVIRKAKERREAVQRYIHKHSLYK